MRPGGVDAERGEDTIPLSCLVPSSVPECGLTQASAGYGEGGILFVATAISVADSAGTMVPVGR